MRRKTLATVAALLLPGAVWAAFSAPDNVSNNVGQSVAPALSATPPMVVWADNTDESGQATESFRLRYAGYPPGGPAGVIPGIQSLDESLLPRSATDTATGVIHVVFQNRILGRYDIFHVSSPDGGATWSGPQNLSRNTGDSVTPAVDIDDAGWLHVVWSDSTGPDGGTEILYARRNPMNGIWSAPANLSKSPGTTSAFPDLVVSTGRLASVVWIDNSTGGTSVFFSRQTPDDAFTTPRNVSGQLFTGPLGDSAPDLARGVNDWLHLVWAGAGSPDGTEIYYQYATFPGATFSGPRNVSWSAGASTTPSVAVDGSNQAHIVWSDTAVDPHGNIRYARIIPGSPSTFPVAIVNTGGRSLLPDVVTDPDDAIFVCWQDDQESVPGANFEILCASAAEAVSPRTVCEITPPPDPQCGGYTTDPASVSLTTTDNSGSVSRLAYRIGKGASTVISFGACPTSGPFGTSFSVGGDGSHRVRFSASDCAGNVEPERECVVKIDTEAPATTAKLSPGCGNNCPVHPGPVRVALSAVDPVPGSGVETTQFRLDGGRWERYHGPFKVSAEGPHTVEFYSEDASCNVEPVKRIEFELLSQVIVQIHRPREGAVYLNDDELIDTDIPIVATVIGKELTFEITVITPDDVGVSDVFVAVGKEIRGHDPTDRPSGATYSITTSLPSPKLTLSEIATVTAVDVKGRLGQAKIVYNILP